MVGSHVTVKTHCQAYKKIEITGDMNALRLDFTCHD